MFQITDFTEARLATLTPRAEKHGDDEVPAVSLALEIETGNTLLDCIDPTLRQALYKAIDEQPELPGVETATPVLRSNSIDRVTLPTKHEGWTLAVDDGIDDTQPKTFGGCKVDKLSVEPKQGGSIVLRLRIGTSDIDAERSGMLGMHVGQPIWIKLTPPEKKPDAIDGSVEAFQRDHPDATDLFAAQHGGAPADGADDIEDDEDAGPELEGRLDNALAAADADASGDPQRGDNWPFPRAGTPDGTGDAADVPAGAAPDGEAPAVVEQKPRRGGRKAAAEVE